MTMLIIFFPVATSFFDGLRRTEPGWLELARSMDATGWRTLCLIRVPAVLPALASGLRVAAAVAPIGADIGGWVGAGAGLGYSCCRPIRAWRRTSRSLPWQSSP